MTDTGHVLDASLILDDNGTLRFSDIGEGTPVLLVHGTGGPAWADSPGRLARNHRVITYARRGFGGSSPAITDDYLEHQISDAAMLASRLRIMDSTVVGHSWGGLVAMGLALRHPDVVGRLVLMEPPLHVKRHPTPGFLMAFLRIQVERRRQGDVAAARSFLRYASTRSTGASTYDELPAPLRAALDADAAGTLAELDAGTGEQIHSRDAAGINAPVLLLEGALSQRVFRKASARIAAQLPQAHAQVIPGAGHMMQLDAPADVDQAIASFAG